VRNTSRSPIFSADGRQDPLVPTLRVPANEWQVLATARPNVLLEGPESTLEATLLVLETLMVDPVHRVRGGEPFTLPATAIGTLVVEHADRLSSEEQSAVMSWVAERQAGLQVISTSTRRLFTMTNDDRFSATLYYRLNVVRLALFDERDASV